MCTPRFSRQSSLSLTYPLGLTLIEMLVTLLITSILALMGFRVIERFTISQEGLSYQSATQRGLALTWAQIEQDLEILSFLSPRQWSVQLARTPLGYRMGSVTWTLGEDGALIRTGLVDSTSMVFLRQVASVRLTLIHGDEERELGAYSPTEIERISRQAFGIAVAIQMKGEPAPLRKIFLAVSH
jgi:prepilin-type N-terminal cleavage/methylation domain-containing protein